MGYTFNDHWITETLRLRESLWGPLEDSAEAGRARAHGGDFEARLLSRSRQLAHREGLTDALVRWRMLARLSLLLFSVAAFIVGCAAAAGALGSGGAVNLAPAVVALLGLNTIAFVLWLVSFGMQTGATGSLLAGAWLSFTKKLARGPDAALLPRALLELLARQRLQRWAAGVLSHWFWTLALTGALITLLGLLATRRYTFQWETTLLSPDTFVMLVQGLGMLPSLIGFPQPPADFIRDSGGMQPLPAAAHSLWSVWLIGVVVVYGLLPRIAALVVSALIVRRRFGSLMVNTSLPGLAELQDKLMPASESTGIDAPPPPLASGRVAASVPPTGHAARGVLGVELPSDLNWPPFDLPDGAADFGVVDTREQRRQVLESLRRQPADRLLVGCDARQTPDRGTLALLTELASLSGELRLMLLPQGGRAARRSQWQQQLLRAGFAPEQMHDSTGDDMQWLTAAARSPVPNLRESAP